MTPLFSRDTIDFEWRQLFVFVWTFCARAKSSYVYKRLSPFMLAPFAQFCMTTYHSTRDFTKKGNTYSIHTPIRNHTTSPLLWGIRPDFPRSHSSHSSCTFDWRESKMRHSIVFRDQTGDINCCRRHFDSSPETLAFSVLLLVVEVE
jgi:hypothetical protein